MMLFRSWPFAIAAALILVGSLSARAGDVRLENLTFHAKAGRTARVKRLEFDGTNLSAKEVGELFSGGLARTKLAPLIAKLRAAKIVIPEVVVSDGSGSITFRDFQATGVSAGRIAHLTLAGFDGAAKLPGAGRVTLHSGPIVLDGGDFSRLLPALADGDLASAGPAEITHFVWRKFTLRFPDTSTPASATGGNLYKVAIASVEGRGTFSGDLPDQGSGKLESLTIEPPKASQLGRALAELGYDRIDVSFTVKGSYNAAAKTYALDDYTIRGAGAGSIGFKATFGDIGKGAFTGDEAQRLAALENGNVSRASVHIVNDGLFEKAVGLFAKIQKKTPAALKERWSILAQEIFPVLLHDNSAAPKLAAAVVKFIAAPKKLTITAKAKGAPLAFSEIRAMAPALLLQRIALDATAQ